MITHVDRFDETAAREWSRLRWRESGGRGIGWWWSWEVEVVVARKKTIEGGRSVVGGEFGEGGPG